MSTTTTYIKKKETLVPVLRFKEYDGEWNPNRIENVAKKVTSGSRDWAQYYSNSGDKFIRMTNLPKNGINLLLDDLKYVKLPEESSEGKRTSLDSGDILISITAELGKIGWVPDDLGLAYINQHTALVKLTSKVDAKYVAYQLSSYKNNIKLNRLNDSGAKSGLNLSTIRSFSIYFPTLPEQQKIASFLNAVDEKIQQLAKKKELLKQYKKGIMQQLFRLAGSGQVSGQLRFKDEKGNPYPDWLKEKISTVCLRSAGRSKSNHIIETGVNIIVDMGAISREGKLLGSKRTNCQEDFLETDELVMAKDDIGRGYIIGKVITIPVKNKYVLGDHVYKLKVIKGDVKYLYYSINSYEVNKSFRRKANGTAQIGINNKTVDEQVIPFPSIEEQQKIASYLSSIDTKIESVHHQITQTQTFKKGVLQQMFV